jgi:hypothetical protein
MQISAIILPDSDGVDDVIPNAHNG